MTKAHIGRILEAKLNQQNNSKDGFIEAHRNIHHSIKIANLERAYLYPCNKFPTSCWECHSFEKGALQPISSESNIQEMWWGEVEASADGSSLNPTTRWKANVLRALTSNDRHLSKRNFVRTSYKSKDRLWSFLLAIALVHEVREINREQKGKPKGIFILQTLPCSSGISLTDYC